MLAQSLSLSYEVGIVISTSQGVPVAQNIAWGHRTHGWQSSRCDPASHGSLKRQNGEVAAGTGRG